MSLEATRTRRTRSVLVKYPLGTPAWFSDRHLMLEIRKVLKKEWSMDWGNVLYMYSEDANWSQSEDVARRSFFSASRRADEATRQYNSALIVDAESYGSGWPLRPAKMATL